MKNNRLLIFCTLFLFGFITKAHAQVQIIETVAGNGTAAFLGNGTAASAAEVDNPYQLALDKYGNLYFADQSDNRIRKIDTAGIISTVAGTGTAGYSGDGAAATAAKISGATGVAVDTAGNIYIADAGNNRIRVVSAATGFISTIANTAGTAGYSGDGALATAAKISNPRCIVLDDTGNIYFSDAGNQRIRKISRATGDISTLAGNGTAGYTGDMGAAISAELKNPRGIAVDTFGNVYIADMTNNCIRMVSAGIITTIAGTGTAGYTGDGSAAVSAELNLPAGVSVDVYGDVYIADVSNNVIRMIDLTGNINTIAGDGTSGYAGDGGVPTSAELSGPIAVALTATGYYISDRGSSQRIRYVRPNSTPTFADSSTQFITVCENSGTTDISSYLAANDSDLNQTEEWFASTVPANGTLNASDVEGSTGGTVFPVGINYTPNTGFSGTDSFIILVYDGFAVSYDTIYMIVSPLPNQGTITGSSSICIDNTFTFVDTASGGSGFWALTNGAAIVDGTGDVTGESIGTDTLLYIVSNTCGTDSAGYTISVNTFFVPSLSISANPGDTSCFGLAVTYIANPVNGGPSPAYTWSVNGTAMATGDTFVYTPNNGDIISCTLTSDAQCLLAADTVSTAITMIVNGGIVPTITISDGIYGDTVCISTLVPYTATITGGGAAPTYLWSVNGSPYSYGTPFDYTPSDGDVINCMLISSAACAIPDSVTSNSITMLVNTTETPAVTITAVPGDTVCLGSPITITASALYGGFSPFFRWTKDGVNVATGPDFTFTPDNGDSIYCMLQSSSSCSDELDVFSTILHTGVDSPVIPSVVITSFSGSSLSIGAMDTLVAVASNATNPLYQWYINGVPVPGATSALFIAGDTTAITATIICIVTSNDPCHETAASNTLVVTVSDENVNQVSLAGTELQLLPNPNRGAFSIQGTVPADTKQVTLQVSDILGHLVYTETVPVQNGILRSQVVMDNNSPNGIYLMHITAGNVNNIIRFTLNR